MPQVPHPAVLLATSAAVVGGAFALAAVASARRAVDDPDLQLHDALHERLDTPAGEAMADIAPTVDRSGKWWVYAPVALAAAGAVLAAPDRREATRGEPRTARSRRAGAIAVAIVPVIVSALSPALDDWLPQPPVGPRKRPVDHPVFPSGHAFRVTGVALTAAYVTAREGLVPAAVAFPVAVAVSSIIGISRLVREKHLASDVVGGWLAGFVVAAGTLSVYEAVRRGPRRRPGPRHVAVDAVSSAAAAR